MKKKNTHTHTHKIPKHILKKKRKKVPLTLIRVIRNNKNPPKERRERQNTHSFVWEKYGLNQENTIKSIQNRMGKRRVKT